MGEVSSLTIGPAPSTTVPPPVNDTGAIGSSQDFALADHTHVSTVFATVVATTDSTGAVSWTYPANFFKVTPVIALTVEDTSANAMDAKLTSNTATGGSAKIIASSPLPSPLLSLTALVGLNIFGGTVPVGTKLHVIARRKTGT